MSPARLSALRGAGGAEALGKTPTQRKQAVLEGNSADWKQRRRRVPPTGGGTLTGTHYFDAIRTGKTGTDRPNCDVLPRSPPYIEGSKYRKLEATHPTPCSLVAASYRTR